MHSSSVRNLSPISLDIYLTSSTGQAGTPTTLEAACYASGDYNADRRNAVEGIAKYLESLTPKGIRCGLDHKQTYYNLVTYSINGKNYEANLYFTGRVSQTQSADYSW